MQFQCPRRRLRQAAGDGERFAGGFADNGVSAGRDIGRQPADRFIAPQLPAALAPAATEKLERAGTSAPSAVVCSVPAEMVVPPL